MLNLNQNLYKSAVIIKINYKHVSTKKLVELKKRKCTDWDEW